MTQRLRAATDGLSEPRNQVRADTALQIEYMKSGMWTSQRIGFVLRDAAHQWGDREFLKMEDDRYSFRSLNNWVNAASAHFVSLGIAPGDRVAMQMTNCIELVVAQFAVWRIGAIAVPIIPIYRAREMGSILDDARPSLIIASHSAGSRFPSAEIDTVLEHSRFRPIAKIVVGTSNAGEGWLAFTCEPSEDVGDGSLPQPSAPEDCCIILYTSGTSSQPKGVKANGLCLLSATIGWHRVLRLTSATVAFSGAPLTHIGALYSALLAPLTAGARTVIMSHWDADRAIQMIEEESVTYMAGAAIFLHDMVDRYERGAAPRHRLEMFISGGAFTAPQLVERAQKVGVVASRTYGMTETCGSITLSPLDAPLDRRGRTEGQVVPGTEIVIVDDDGTAVPFGALGHIRIKSPQLMLGYTDYELDKSQFDADGWFYAGDMGTITSDGWLTMVGRTKDIINRGGEKFSAQDIETALMSCEHIRNVSIIGTPDDRFGERVCACVIPAGTWSGPEAVLEHLEAIGLARAKFPVEWLILDDLPRTASGKVQKAVLVELALGARAASGNGAISASQPSR